MKTTLTLEDKVNLIVELIKEKKGKDIISLKVKDLTPITDYFLICSGETEKQTQTIADFILKILEEKGEKPLGVEGFTEGRWILIDYGDIIIHIFKEDIREFYGLEYLWGDVEIKKYD